MQIQSGFHRFEPGTPAVPAMHHTDKSMRYGCPYRPFLWTSATFRLNPRYLVLSSVPDLLITTSCWDVWDRDVVNDMAQCSAQQAPPAAPNPKPPSSYTTAAKNNSARSARHGGLWAETRPLKVVWGVVPKEFCAGGCQWQGHDGTPGACSHKVEVIQYGACSDH